MATQKDIAQFFRLALRLHLADTTAVERWVDSIIAAEAVVSFPFTDLAGASHLSSATVDDLLGLVDGVCEVHSAGRIVLALLRRQLRDGTLTHESAIRHARAVGLAAPLTDKECNRADALDDLLSLAASDSYGTTASARREIAEFFESYAEFDGQIPLVTTSDRRIVRRPPSQGKS